MEDPNMDPTRRREYFEKMNTDLKEMAELMWYSQIEKKYLIDKKERLTFLAIQMVMMDGGFPMKDAPGYLRRVAGLIEELLKSGIFEMMLKNNQGGKP